MPTRSKISLANRVPEERQDDDATFLANNTSEESEDEASSHSSAGSSRRFARSESPSPETAATNHGPTHSKSIDPLPVKEAAADGDDDDSDKAYSASEASSGSSSGPTEEQDSEIKTPQDEPGTHPHAPASSDADHAPATTTTTTPPPGAVARLPFPGAVVVGVVPDADGQHTHLVQAFLMQRGRLVFRRLPCRWDAVAGAVVANPLLGARVVVARAAVQFMGEFAGVDEDPALLKKMIRESFRSKFVDE